MSTDIPLFERLRERCVEVHNAINWTAGRTLLSEVGHSLAMPFEVESQSAAHKLVSAYCFFSSSPLVVEHRHRFDDRLHDHADDRLRARLRELRNAPFGAWTVDGRSSNDSGDERATAECRCVGRPEFTGSQTCRLVGFGEGPPETDAEMYAGWHVTRSGEPDLLMFATPIGATAADILRRAAGRQGWTVDGVFQRPVYERDVVVATTAAGEFEVGAARLWFLPPHLRPAFTARTFRFLMKRIAREGLLGAPGTSLWHLDLVNADQQDRRDEVRERLETYRRDAFQKAARQYRVDTDASQAHHVGAIDEILVALGAGPDGRIELAPVDAPGTQRRRADETHRLRLRWVALMSHFEENLEHYDRSYALGWLALDYTDLRRVLEELFDEVYGDLPLSELPRDPNGQLPIITDTLVRTDVTETPPVRLRDLPPGDLEELPGIGEKRADLIDENLRELLFGWRG